MAAGSSIMDNLFQRTLEDLIKGLRLQLIGESAFISKALDEIRRELKSTDLDTKSTALLKLTYLNSIYAIDMSFAAFQVVELMGSSHFLHKKIAYLAASQSFHDATDVILLITNQLRKDLTGGNEFEICLALECLSKIANLDLARDLTPEVFTLLAASKSHVRKKAIGVVLRVFSKYPDAVRVCFKRLVENLESSDPQTVSATVGVFCELTSQDPKTYLPLAPEFYRVLVDSKNNWVLIKTLKIFAKLVPLEPRLGKRVVEPICEHMRRTGAKSLMFECVRTIVTSLAEYESAVKLAVVKIRELIVDDDPNLRYLGLQGLAIVAEKHLWAVVDNKEIIIKSLSDADPNIRLESLRLVMAMVSENNVTEISTVLVNYALKSDPEFCNEILGYVLFTCSRNFYEIIVDFDWYVTLMGDISRIPQCQRGEEIENQLIDIGLRVRDVRPQLVHVARDLLIDPALLSNPHMHRILSAAAWVSGEYVEFSRNPLELMEALVQPRTNLLPTAIRAVYVHSALKVLISCADEYLSINETAASNLEFQGIISKRKSREGTPSDVEHDEVFNPRSASQLSEELPLETCSVTNAIQEEASSISLGKEVNEKSLFDLVTLVEKALGPLIVSCEVELLERARNVNAFTKLIKRHVFGSLHEKEASAEEYEQKIYEIVKAMQDALSEELRPVSSSAQERVLVPDGFILKESLGELEVLCGDIQLHLPASFSLGTSKSEERLGNTNYNIQKKGEQQSQNETTSLLVEHRKRHGLYYLPSEETDISANDYPPANDSKSGDIFNDDTRDLAKLTEHSLISKKKATHSKPRPVVIKLDGGGDICNAAKKFEPKDNSLSGAVWDVLNGTDAIPASSQRCTIALSSRIKGKDKAHGDLPSEHVEATDNPETGKPSNKTKRHSHGKETKHKIPGRNGEMREDVQKDKRSGHRHSKNRSRQRTDRPLSEPVQAPTIPDFLL